MKKTSLSLLSIGLLFFICGALVGQELQGFNDDLENISVSAIESASAGQEVLLSTAAAPPSTNMLGGFMQFLVLVAVSVSALIVWMAYRNRRAEQMAALDENWG